MYADRGAVHAPAPGSRSDGPVVAHEVGSAWALADLLAVRPDAAVLDTPLLRQALEDARARRAVAAFVGLLTELGVRVSVDPAADDACRALAADLGVGPAAMASDQRTGILHAETHSTSA
jgi:hypothetical protein